MSNSCFCRASSGFSVRSCTECFSFSSPTSVARQVGGGAFANLPGSARLGRLFATRSKQNRESVSAHGQDEGGFRRRREFFLLRWETTYLVPATFIKGADRGVELFNRDSHGLSETRRANETKGGVGEGETSRESCNECEAHAPHKMRGVRRSRTELAALTGCGERQGWRGVKKSRVRCGRREGRKKLF